MIFRGRWKTALFSFETLYFGKMCAPFVIVARAFARVYGCEREKVGDERAKRHKILSVIEEVAISKECEQV